MKDKILLIEIRFIIKIRVKKDLLMCSCLVKLKIWAAGAGGVRAQMQQDVVVLAKYNYKQ